MLGTLNKSESLSSNNLRRNTLLSSFEIMIVDGIILNGWDLGKLFNVSNSVDFSAFFYPQE